MTSSNRIHIHSFAVPTDAIDENGPVNNVIYVQWMQDIAVEHFESIGGVNPMQLVGATGVVVHEVRIESPSRIRA